MNAQRCLICFIALTPAVRAEDWPQWLGPRRDGSSAEKVAPWKEAPKVLWRVAVGDGHGSPVVAGGKVFLHTKVKDRDAERISAYDAVSGKPVWSKDYARDKFVSVFGVGPRSTPAVVEDKVYTLGVTGILACWDAANGKQVWSVDTTKTYVAPPLTFGVSGSPLIADDNVLVNVGAKGASLVAFDRHTGKETWKGFDDRASYSSPILLGSGKSRQALFLTAAGLRSVSPATGSPLWFVPLVDLLNESSTTPVVVDDLVLASSVTFGMLAAQLAESQGKPTAAQKWKNAQLTCYFSTPVPVGKDHVYLVTGSALNPLNPTSALRCVEARTGKVLWTRERVAKYHAALLRTGDDRLLMLDDFGNVKLLEPNPKEYRELATAKVCKPTWAHPALSEGRLYLRDKDELICLQLK